MARRYTRTSGGALASMGSTADTLRAIAYRLIHEAGPRGRQAIVWVLPEFAEQVKP